jgi:hypothetical protein
VELYVEDRSNAVDQRARPGVVTTDDIPLSAAPAFGSEHVSLRQVIGVDDIHRSIYVERELAVANRDNEKAGASLDVEFAKHRRRAQHDYV